MSISISKLVRRFAPVIALVALVVAMDGTWATAQPTPVNPPARPAPARGPTTGAPAPSPASAAPSPSPTPTTSPTPPTTTTTADPATDPPPRRPTRKEVTGKLNLNTATEEQLLLLPTVGPSKAERIIAWRKKNGGFRRIADLRRVKGFGYKTLKRLEPFLDIQGETTLAAKR